MPFVKVVKNKAYFKRFQVKYRRRREGKTDYQARRALVLQDRTKYNTPKFRLVARITNTDVIAQIVQPTLTGDRVIASAYSHELPAFGVKVGLTNYSACYCTGLLLARRILKKVGLDKEYAGVKEVDGTYYSSEDHTTDRRPFKAVLDTGLTKTTTGARVFGVMKGAVDGGLNVPHSEKRFPGYSGESLNATVHRERIMGVHVSKYMQSLMSEDREAYERQFSRYVKAGISADGVEKMYKAAHAAIRADPSKTVKSDKKKSAPGTKPKRYNKRPLSLRARRTAVRAKLQKVREFLKL